MWALFTALRKDRKERGTVYTRHRLKTTNPMTKPVETQSPEGTVAGKARSSCVKRRVCSASVRISMV